MLRIIEILKEIRINHESLSLPYLINKFNLTARTIQKDIRLINNLFSKDSDCKIIFRKNILSITGNDNVEKVIEKILLNFANFTQKDKIVQIYQLLLLFIYKPNYTYTYFANSLAFLEIDKYMLKQNINLINNYFFYHSLNLKLIFKTKVGWWLKGNEIELRFVLTNILINQEIGLLYLKKINLLSLFSKLEQIFLKRNFYQRYLITELIWSIVILIKRIENNETLNKSYFNFSNLLQKKIINDDLNKISNLLNYSFNLKLNNYELQYLKSLLYMTSANSNSELLERINQDIIDLVFNQYNLPISKVSFQKKLINFLKTNFLKIYFNFYSSINFGVMVFPLPFNSKNFFSWEIIKIINFVLKKFDIGLKTNLLINVNLFKIFNNLFQEKQVNCRIPLYYVENNFDKFNNIKKHLMLFLNTNYPNLIIKSLILNNSIQQLNLINKNYSIVLHKGCNIEWSNYKYIYPVDYNTFELNNNKLELYINKHINNISFKRFISKIFIFDFFIKQNFFNLKNLLLILQEAILKKYKLNTLSFQLENSFFEHKYLSSNILLIIKTIPINNIEIPVILTYLKKSLIFYQKYKVKYLFVLVIDCNKLYKKNLIGLFLEKFIKHNKLTNNSITVKNLYTIINSL